MVAPKMTTDEKRWQAEGDAYTLMQAEEVKLDRIRLNAAKREVKKLVCKKEKELNSTKKIAGTIKKKSVVKRKPIVKKRVTRKTKK